MRSEIIEHYDPRQVSVELLRRRKSFSLSHPHHCEASHDAVEAIIDGLSDTHTHRAEPVGNGDYIVYFTGRAT
jgi:hypothetical protein